MPGRLTTRLFCQRRVEFRVDRRRHVVVGQQTGAVERAHDLDLLRQRRRVDDPGGVKPRERFRRRARRIRAAVERGDVDQLCASGESVPSALTGVIPASRSSVEPFFSRCKRTMPY